MCVTDKPGIGAKACSPPVGATKTASLQRPRPRPPPAAGPSGWWKSSSSASPVPGEQGAQGHGAMGIPGSPRPHTSMVGTLSNLPWSLTWVNARTVPQEAWDVHGHCPNTTARMGAAQDSGPSGGQASGPFRPAGRDGLVLRGPITWAKSGFCPDCLPNFAFMLKKKKVPKRRIAPTVCKMKSKVLSLARLFSASLARPPGPARRPGPAGALRAGVKPWLRVALYSTFPP